MPRTTNITAVGTVAVPVTDQDRAVEFYVGTLGFEKRRDLPFGDARWVEVAPPGSATTIALVAGAIPTGIRLFTADAGRDHAALRSGGAAAGPEGIAQAGGPAMFGG